MGLHVREFQTVVRQSFGVLKRADANPDAFCFEIHQLLRITPRIFKHDLEQWPRPLDYIESRAVSKVVVSPSPWLYETKDVRTKESNHVPLIIEDQEP